MERTGIGGRVGELFIIESIADKLIEFIVNLLFERVRGSSEEAKNNEMWKKAIRKAFAATEGMKESYIKCMEKDSAIQRHFIWLTSNKPLDGIYDSFIITMAVDLCRFNVEKEFAIPFGCAILDNWFELRKMDSAKLKSDLSIDSLVKIINDREILYRKYFLLYDEPLSKDAIRVYYPKNGETWVEWDKKCSVVVKVNISKGTEFGFFRIGFYYSRVQENGEEVSLKVAYIQDDREIFRFTNIDSSEIKGKRMLWVN